MTLFEIDKGQNKGQAVTTFASQIRYRSKMSPDKSVPAYHISVLLLMIAEIKSISTGLASDEKENFTNTLLFSPIKHAFMLRMPL